MGKEKEERGLRGKSGQNTTTSLRIMSKNDKTLNRELSEVSLGIP